MLLDMTAQKVLDGILKFFKGITLTVLWFYLWNSTSFIFSTQNSIHTNSYDPRGKEKNDDFPFWDILLINQLDGMLQRNIYRKAAWVDRY